jgi:hypothetical protein
MKKLFVNICVIVCLFVTNNINAQNNTEFNPVKWTYEVKENTDKVKTIYIKASIEKGYHIFSNKPGDDDGFLIPTSITIIAKNNKGLKIEIPITDRLANKKAITAKIAEIGEVSYYETDVTYSMPYDSNFAKGQIDINYQCCNDKMCFPPTNVVMDIK